MSWARTLKSWATGEPERSGVTDLPQLGADLDREAHRLARHAELAPNHSAEWELTRLAAEQRAIAAGLRDALDNKADMPAAAEPSPPASLNHWARLVQDLEHMRSQRDRLVDAAGEQTGDDPLRELLDDLFRRIELQLSGVRGLIARADPQALN